MQFEAWDFVSYFCCGEQFATKWDHWWDILDWRIGDLISTETYYTSTWDGKIEKTVFNKIGRNTRIEHKCDGTETSRR